MITVIPSFATHSPSQTDCVGLCFYPYESSITSLDIVPSPTGSGADAVRISWKQPDFPTKGFGDIQTNTSYPCGGFRLYYSLSIIPTVSYYPSVAYLPITPNSCQQAPPYDSSLPTFTTTWPTPPAIPVEFDRNSIAFSYYENVGGGLLPDQLYCFMVYAGWNPSFYGTVSKQECITTGSGTAPPPPPEDPICPFDYVIVNGVCVPPTTTPPPPPVMPPPSPVFNFSELNGKFDMTWTLTSFTDSPSSFNVWWGPSSPVDFTDPTILLIAQSLSSTTRNFSITVNDNGLHCFNVVAVWQNFPQTISNTKCATVTGLPDPDTGGGGGHDDPVPSLSDITALQQKVGALEGQQVAQQLEITTIQGQLTDLQSIL